MVIDAFPFQEFPYITLSEKSLSVKVADILGFPPTPQTTAAEVSEFCLGVLADNE